MPFIANYRKEYIEPELNIDDLWKVWAWDEKVCCIGFVQNVSLSLLSFQACKYSSLLQECHRIMSSSVINLLWKCLPIYLIESMQLLYECWRE